MLKYIFFNKNNFSKIYDCESVIGTISPKIYGIMKFGKFPKTRTKKILSSPTLGAWHKKISDIETAGGRQIIEPAINQINQKSGLVVT